MAKLLVGFARIARAAFRLNDSQYIAAGVVQTVIRYPVPRLRVVTIDGNFETDLGAVIKLPAGITQRRVDQEVSSLALVERISVAWLFHAGAAILPERTPTAPAPMA